MQLCRSQAAGPPTEARTAGGGLLAHKRCSTVPREKELSKDVSWLHSNVRNKGLCCKGDCTLDQVAQRSCRLSVLGEPSWPQSWPCFEKWGWIRWSPEFPAILQFLRIGRPFFLIFFYVILFIIIIILNFILFTDSKMYPGTFIFFYIFSYILSKAWSFCISFKS